ncbi:hypothetical protein [Colwellia sp. MEBiC06753]
MENVSKDLINPYLSILLVKCEESHVHYDYHKAILATLLPSFGEIAPQDISETISDEIGDVGTVQYTCYKEVKAPSWLVGGEYLNTEYHAIITFQVDTYLGIYFSDSTKKDEIRAELGSSKLEHLHPINIKQLNYNFINEDEISMLWLSGTHGRNNYKADSKVLGGESVADTLDPLLDQSYMMSAVRTYIAGQDTTYGINPFKSSIWRGPCNSWQKFEDRVIEILDQLRNNPQEVENPISILSYPISHGEDLKVPYDFTLLDYEFLQEKDGQYRKELLRKLKYDYRAELRDPFAESGELLLDVYYLNNKVGELTVTPEIIDYKVKFTISNILVKSGGKRAFEQYIKVFQYPDLIKCWYESGHAIVNGMIFKTGYKDVDYSKFMWTYFDNHDITKEKPGVTKTNVDLSKIGLNNSLFCWVKNNWDGLWLEQKDFQINDSPKGWLYCDDGAGEKADFIHLVNYQGLELISLIHVKAAKSDKNTRDLSVGVHDIVLNQAIKNIRYCSRKALHEALNERFNNSEKKLCWYDGTEKSPIEFLDYLKSIKDNNNVKTRVVVIQPHTQRSKYDNAQTKNRRRQLDVLLVSAENTIQSTGASFHIIGVQDQVE